MKKILALVLASIMIFAIVGCQKADDPAKKSEGVMTYAQYMAAKVDDPVVIEAYVQATQSWWENKITVYAADKDGAYFIYNMTCSEADSKKLTAGTKIKVTGHKGEWSGEIEIAEGATFVIEEGSYIASPVDLTSVFGTDDLIKHQNEKFSVKNAVVQAVGKDDGGNDAAFFYKWDNSGTEGDDLYFKVKIGENDFTFTVESYLCGKDTDVYKAVQALKIGDKIDVEGFLYWYEGANPHITSVTASK